jgi:hypothetical protein
MIEKGEKIIISNIQKIHNSESRYYVNHLEAWRSYASRELYHEIFAYGIFSSNSLTTQLLILAFSFQKTCRVIEVLLQMSTIFGGTKKLDIPLMSLEKSRPSYVTCCLSIFFPLQAVTSCWRPQCETGGTGVVDTGVI